MLRAAVFALLFASALSPQISVDALRLEAILPGRAFAPRERVIVQFAITNRSQRHLSVPDPSRGPALRVRLRTPAGEKHFSIAEAAHEPGVPDIPANWQMPPGARRVFEFDVAALARVAATGSYAVTLDYQMPGAALWKSPEMSFAIAPAAGAFLEVVESESSRKGPYSLLWTEREGASARVLLLPLAMTAELREVWGATALGRVPAGSAPALSVSPPGQDFPDRWLVWTEGPQLRYLYWARDPSAALPPAGIPAQAEARLVRPPLADAPPASGRPACHVAWLSRARLQRAVIEGGGKVRMLPPVALGGEAVNAWAVSPRAGERLYVIAFQAGDQSRVESIRCRGETCSAPVVRFRLPGRVEAGDLRMAGPDAVAAFALSRPSGWVRVTLRLVEGAVPRTEALPPVPAVERASIALDAAGAAPLVLADKGQFLYFRPGSNAPARIPRKGSLFGLLPGSAGLELVVYDSEHGPEFVALPR